MEIHSRSASGRLLGTPENKFLQEMPSLCEVLTYFGSALLGLLMLFFVKTRSAAVVALLSQIAVVFLIWLYVGWLRRTGYRDWHYGNLLYIPANAIFGLIYLWLSVKAVFCKRLPQHR